MPSDIKEAERMLDLFNSVGARSIVVTKTDINQALIWGKTYQAAELNKLLPTMVRTAAIRPKSLKNKYLDSPGGPDGSSQVRNTRSKVWAGPLRTRAWVQCSLVNAGLFSVVSCVKTGLWGYVVRGESVAFFSPSFKSRRTARIVFQLRVVAGTPNSLSIWPR